MEGVTGRTDMGHQPARSPGRSLQGAARQWSLARSKSTTLCATRPLRNVHVSRPTSQRTPSPKLPLGSLRSIEKRERSPRALGYLCGSGGIALLVGESDVTGGKEVRPFWRSEFDLSVLGGGRRPLTCVLVLWATTRSLGV